MQNNNMSADLASRLAGNNGQIDINVYRKKTPSSNIKVGVML